MQYVKGRGERVYELIASADDHGLASVGSSYPTPNDLFAVHPYSPSPLHPHDASNVVTQTRCKPRSQKQVPSFTHHETKPQRQAQRVSDTTLTSADATGTATPARAEQGRRIGPLLAVHPRVLLSAAAKVSVTALTRILYGDAVRILRGAA